MRKRYQKIMLKFQTRIESKKSCSFIEHSLSKVPRLSSGVNDRTMKERIK